MSEEKSVKKIDYSKNPVVLSASHVSKCFKLPTEQATGLKQAFINWTRGIKGYKKQQVLKDISFEVHQGEFFGIVGRNGGGKSTLLKLISQIYYPESGSITVSGMPEFDDHEMIVNVLQTWQENGWEKPTLVVE